MKLIKRFFRAIAFWAEDIIKLPEDAKRFFAASGFIIAAVLFLKFAGPDIYSGLAKIPDEDVKNAALETSASPAAIENFPEGTSPVEKEIGPELQNMIREEARPNLLTPLAGIIETIKSLKKMFE